MLVGKNNETAATNSELQLFLFITEPLLYLSVAVKSTRRAYSEDFSLCVTGEGRGQYFGRLVRVLLSRRVVENLSNSQFTTQRERRRALSMSSFCFQGKQTTLALRHSSNKAQIKECGSMNKTARLTQKNLLCLYLELHETSAASSILVKSVQSERDGGMWELLWGFSFIYFSNKRTCLARLTASAWSRSLRWGSSWKAGAISTTFKTTTFFEIISKKRAVMVNNGHVFVHQLSTNSYFSSLTVVVAAFFKRHR